MSLNALQERLDVFRSAEQLLELPLYEESGLQVGAMRPLNRLHAEEIAVVEKLTEWRNANMSSFLTQFKATRERTKTWLRDVVLANQGQMLFLVYDQNNELIGHFGFKNLTSKTVLLDNALRGERKGHPKLFVVAGKTLVRWLWRETTVQRIDGLVIADNIPSIMMSRQIGFKGWKRRPLIKNSTDGTVIWTIGKKGQLSPDNLHCFIVFINRPAEFSASANPPSQ